MFKKNLVFLAYWLTLPAFAQGPEPILHPTCEIRLIGGDYLIQEGPKRWSAGLEKWGDLGNALTAKGFRVVEDGGRGFAPMAIHEFPQDTLYAEVGFRKTYLPADTALVEFLFRIQWVVEISRSGEPTTWTLARQISSDLGSDSKLLTLRSARAEEKAMKVLPECRKKR